jgi:hypothetical protein
MVSVARRRARALTNPFNKLGTGTTDDKHRIVLLASGAGRAVVRNLRTCAPSTTAYDERWNGFCRFPIDAFRKSHTHKEQTFVVKPVEKQRGMYRLV